MSQRRDVRGITLIGFLFLLSIIGFFAYMAMRLAPMYIEYAGVVKAMEQVKSEPGSGNRSLEEIRRSLVTKFSIQYVDAALIGPSAIKLSRQGNASTLRIHYEKRVPFIYNLEFLATFDKTVTLSGAGE